VENQGFHDLELYARQEFTIDRFNRSEDFYKPVVRAFLYMQPGHDVYKRAIEKVKHGYQTWKYRTLHHALKWVNQLSRAVRSSDNPFGKPTLKSQRRSYSRVVSLRYPPLDVL
jgi:hypothetical protein